VPPIFLEKLGLSCTSKTETQTVPGDTYNNFIIITESLYFIKCRWENEKFNTLHAAKALSRA
jgi:hypothetical protein